MRRKKWTKRKHRPYFVIVLLACSTFKGSVKETSKEVYGRNGNLLERSRETSWEFSLEIKEVKRLRRLLGLRKA